MRFNVAFFILFAAVSSAVAQSPVPLLLPIAPVQNVPGANGSLWTASMLVENSSDHDISLFLSNCFVCSPAPYGIGIPPNGVADVTQLPFGGDFGPHLFVWPDDLPFIRIHLRVRDMSRESQTYGTEIPVVTQAQFHPTIRLIDVPTDPRFRVTLRIYSSIDGPPPPTSATVTVLPASGTTPLRTMSVAMPDGTATLDPVAGLTDPTVRVIVTSGGPIWAFASVTNNATQDVTTITESRQPDLNFSYATYLLPLVPAQNVPGANGSRWTTDFVVENSSDRTIVLSNDACQACGHPPPPGAPVTVPPQSTVTDPPITQMGLGAQLFLFDAGDIAAIRTHMRVRDMSREADTYGTEIPVAVPSLAHPTIRLIDVPADPRFRVTLRIYSFTYGIAPTVTVLPPTGTTPLRTLTAPGGVAQLDPVSGLSASSVRVIIDAGDPRASLWAFISVTDNDTQDVTTITESP